MINNIDSNKISINNSEGLESKIKKATLVKPSQRQLNWQSMELTSFIHFGMNTFIDTEWSDGTASPSEFKLKSLDADQWVSILKEAGFKELILTCKHHDGFCLWPSKYTEYSIKNSPYENGNGDIVKLVSDACRKQNLKFGIYLSPWDRHDERYGDSPKYNQFFLNQLTELLTQYGEISEVWFDGACAEGPNGKRQEYDWKAYYSLIRKLQPNAVISIEGPDVRWVGNEAGKGRLEEWSVVPGKYIDENKQFTQLAVLDISEDLASDKILADLPMDCDCLYWSPAQVDTSIRRGWFYHSWEDHYVKSLYELVKIYDSSVGSNAVLLLNIPPNTKGKISAVDERRIREFGSYLKKSFEENLVSDFSSASAGGNQNINITLKDECYCNCIVLSENIQNGQKVSSFVIEAIVDGKKQQLSSGKTIGYKKIVEFKKIKTKEITVIINGYRAEPEICAIGVFLRPDIVSPPQIKRDLNGNVEIICSNGAKPLYSINGGEKINYTGPFKLSTSGVVEAFAEYQDTFFYTKSVVSDFVQFGILKNKWTVCKPENVQNEINEYVKGKKPYYCFKKFPCELVIDLGETVTALGAQYHPINNAIDFLYNVVKVELSTSSDGKNFTLQFAGEFDNIQNNPVIQSIKFETPCECRYLRIVALEGFDQDIAGIGTFDLIT